MRISEARRNPALNPKLSPLAQLQKYAGRKDVYVSFTTGFTHHLPTRGPQSKLGINPRSNYGTPIGIYCYPVDYILSFSKNSGEIKGPYTGRERWQFLYVFSVGDDGIVENDDDAVIPYARMKEKAEELLGDESESIFKFAKTDSRRKGDKAFLWNLSRILANSDKAKRDTKIMSTTMWSKLMREAGVKMVVDRNDEGLIHPNEPTQAVVFDPRIIKVIDTISRQDRKYIDNSVINRVYLLILDGKFDVNKLDPEWINHMLIDKPLLEKLAQANTMQKKAFGSVLKTMMDSHMFVLKVPMFGVIGRLVDVSLRYFLHELIWSQVPVTEWESSIGRKITKEDWADAISVIEKDHGVNAFFELIPDDIDHNFFTTLVDMFISAPRKDAYNKTSYPYMCRKFVNKAKEIGVTLNNSQLRYFFIYAPMEVKKVYPDFEPTFAEWVRAGRTATLGEIVENIPIAPLKTVLVGARGKYDQKSITEACIRLIDAHEDKFLLWYMLQIKEHRSFPLIIENSKLEKWMTKNFDYLLLKNRVLFELLKYLPKWVPNERSWKIIWKEVHNSFYGAHELLLLVKRNLVSKDAMMNNLKVEGSYNPVLKIYQNAFFNERSLYPFLKKKYGQEMLVDAAISLQRIQFLEYDDVRYMFKKHPEQIAKWRLNGETFVSSEQVSKLFEEFPDLYNNYNALHMMSGEQFFHAVSKGHYQPNFINVGTQVTALGLMAQYANDNSGGLLAMYSDPRFELENPLILVNYGMAASRLRELEHFPMSATTVVKILIDYPSAAPLTVQEQDITKFVDLICDYRPLAVKQSISSPLVTNKIPEPLRTQYQIAALRAQVSQAALNNRATDLRHIEGRIINPTRETKIWIKKNRLIHPE